MAVLKWELLAYYAALLRSERKPWLETFPSPWLPVSWGLPFLSFNNLLFYLRRKKKKERKNRAESLSLCIGCRKQRLTKSICLSCSPSPDAVCAVLPFCLSLGFLLMEPKACRGMVPSLIFWELWRCSMSHGWDIAMSWFWVFLQSQASKCQPVCCRGCVLWYEPIDAVD